MSSYDSALTYMNDRMTKTFGGDFLHISAGGIQTTVEGVFEADELQERVDNSEVIWFETLDQVIAVGDKICRGTIVFQVIDVNPDPGGGTRVTIKDDKGIPLR